MAELAGDATGGSTMPDAAAFPPYVEPAATPAVLDQTTASTVPDASVLSTPSPDSAVIPATTPAPVTATLPTPAPAPATFEAYLAANPEYERRYREERRVAEEAETWARYGRERWEQAAAASKSAASAVVAPEKPAHPWGIPEWDPNNEKHLYLDKETGEVKAKASAPPGLAAQYMDYVAKSEAATVRLMRDPVGAMKDIVVKLIDERASEITRTQIAGVQNDAYVRDYLQKNMDWMAARKPDGSVDASRFSDAGRAYAGYVQMFKDSGMTDVRQVTALAEQLVRGQAALDYYSSRSAPDQSAAGKDNLLASSAAAAAAGPATMPNVATHPTVPSNAARQTVGGEMPNLRELMLNAARAAGENV